MEPEPGRRFLKQPDAKLEPVIVAYTQNYTTSAMTVRSMVV